MLWSAQPHGLSPHENVIKECGEEASIPRELAQRAVPAGAVSYSSEQAEGLKRDVLFCYDLELPQDFVPQPQVPALMHTEVHSCVLFASPLSAPLETSKLVKPIFCVLMGIAFCGCLSSLGWSWQVSECNLSKK